ncbi:MAG: methylated-DNA--[protein]-cysteine S-methyltransferase [Planctomycetota bacterium]
MNYFCIKIKLGWCGVVGSEKGLKEIILPSLSRTMVIKRIKTTYPDIIPKRRLFNDFIEAVKIYFQTGRLNFRGNLDLANITAFNRSVYRVVKTIPPGAVRTYGWVAKQLKKHKAVRAVGNALAKNPLPLVIPCHRVIRSDGTLGKFSALAGISLKKRLLELERKTTDYTD